MINNTGVRDVIAGLQLVRALAYRSLVLGWDKQEELDLVLRGG